MNPSSLPARRLGAYLATALFLAGNALLAGRFEWRGSMHLHTAMEALATVLAGLAGRWR